MPSVPLLDFGRDDIPGTDTQNVAEFTSPSIRLCGTWADRPERGIFRNVGAAHAFDAGGYGYGIPLGGAAHPVRGAGRCGGSGQAARRAQGATVAVLTVAMLGGYLHRKNDPWPGHEKRPGGIYAPRGRGAEQRKTHQAGPQQQLVSRLRSDKTLGYKAGRAEARLQASRLRSRAS